VARRVTGTLTINGKECQGLHLDTLSDYPYLVSPLAAKVYGSEQGWKAALSAEKPPCKVACGNNGTVKILGSLMVQVEGDKGKAFAHRFWNCWYRLDE